MKKQFLLFSSLYLLCVGFSYGQEAVATFVEYRIKDVGTIRIPVTMKLQGGVYKEISEALAKDLLTKKGYDVTGDEVIFQQKGLNEAKGDYSYARVMIGTDHGSPGEYERITAKLKATPEELSFLNSTIKKGLIESFDGLGGKLIRWDGVSIVLVGGRTALKTAYVRQIDTKPSVYVEMYQFQNYDRIHRLTISYRQNDATLWKADLEKTKNSFSITNVRP
ncbi:MAG: hypothetical protein IPI64_05345 [Chloracidobacterium sp.]|nr:hypothetical protein [Chloracidobacterium sp.]